MRSDYALYAVAVICLILASVVFATSYAGYRIMYPPYDTVTVAVLVILGGISAGAGYLTRPEEIVLAPPARPPPPKPAAEGITPTTSPAPKTAPTSRINITEVRGIGPKRAEQLKALDINTAQDLADTSASALAAKTELSPKITQKWIREAKRLLKKAS